MQPPKTQGGRGKRGPESGVNRTVTPVRSPILGREVVGSQATREVVAPVSMELDVGVADRTDPPMSPTEPEEKTPSPVREAGSNK